MTIKAALAGAMLAVMGTAYADVGREESLQEAVRQFAEKLEAQSKICLKTSGTRFDSEQCLKTKEQAATDAVNRKYQAKLSYAQDGLKSMGPLDSDKVPAMLQTSQVQWQQYVKAECDGLYEQSFAGSARGAEAIECRYRLAIQRLSSLDQWYSDPSEPLSLSNTPPSMPNTSDPLQSSVTSTPDSPPPCPTNISNVQLKKINKKLDDFSITLQKLEQNQTKALQAQQAQYVSQLAAQQAQYAAQVAANQYLSQILNKK